MAVNLEVNFFNSFLLKQLNQVVGSTYTPLSPGGFPYNGVQTTGSFEQQMIIVNAITAGSNYNLGTTTVSANNLSTTSSNGAGMTVDILEVNGSGGIVKIY